jgi:hypothetical protein
MNLLKKTIITTLALSGLAATASAQGVADFVHDSRYLYNEFTAIEAGFGVRTFQQTQGEAQIAAQNEFDIRGNYLIQKNIFIGAGYNNRMQDGTGFSRSESEIVIGGGIRNVFINATGETDLYGYFDYLMNTNTVNYDLSTMTDQSNTMNGREFGIGINVSNEAFKEFKAGAKIFNSDYFEDSTMAAQNSSWGMAADIGYNILPTLQIKMTTEMGFDFEDPKLGAALKMKF